MKSSGNILSGTRKNESILRVIWPTIWILDFYKYFFYLLYLPYLILSTFVVYAFPVCVSTRISILDNESILLLCPKIRPCAELLFLIFSHSCSLCEFNHFSDGLICCDIISCVEIYRRIQADHHIHKAFWWKCFKLQHEFSQCSCQSCYLTIKSRQQRPVWFGIGQSGFDLVTVCVGNWDNIVSHWWYWSGHCLDEGLCSQVSTFVRTSHTRVN